MGDHLLISCGARGVESTADVDLLRPYYGRELSEVLRMTRQFAREHPPAARRLLIGDDGEAKDPHVERMIEGFAFLAARVHRKLDDDFPEIVESMLGVLYPHYQAPIPSMAVAQFELDPSQSGLVGGLTVPADTAVETDPRGAELCRFRTRYPVTLWPVEITATTLGAVPFADGPRRPLAGAAAVLRLRLRCVAEDVTFAQLRPTPPARPGTADGDGDVDRPAALRFFIDAEPRHAPAIYELLMNHVVDVTLADHAGDPGRVRLGKGSLRPVGFERDEGLLPYSPRSAPGFRLLTEYFAFPEKFLFVDLVGLTPAALAGFGNALDVCVYLDRATPELERVVSASTLRLGCAPIVNLFERTADPIRLTHRQAEYRVVPDARAPRSHEVYSVDRVVATSPGGGRAEYRPFYSFRHATRAGEQRTFWHASRRPAAAAAMADGDPDGDAGTEIYLAPVDLDLRPSRAAEQTLHVTTTCTNRDAPGRLPFGPGRPQLQLPDGGAVTVRCLTKPTPTLRPRTGKGRLWRLVSHLTLNHASLAGGADGADVLREVLTLYDVGGSADARARVGAIADVRGRRVAGRVGGAVAGGFCGGVEVTVTFDERGFPDRGAFLFASVLERFLAMSCSMNSFSELVARVTQQEKELKRWEPRCGERTLL